MSYSLNILRKNVIFLFIGSRELYFVRFLGGKIFSTRSQKVSYESEHDSIKLFFKDYFAGKEGIPVCIVHDTPNQVFTEYSFLKNIGKRVVTQSIFKKINHEIAQEAVHDFFKLNNQGQKSSQNAYQVVSFVKTPIATLCLDLLNKFPNPIAGLFSMILEMPTICEGTAKRIKLQKPMPVIERDVLDIKDISINDLSIAIQQSPVSGVNFSLYQGSRVLFHHNLVCGKFDYDAQKDVESTIATILDYCKQMDVEYRCYVYGSEELLKSILKTDIQKTSMYYTHPEILNPKLFYHKQFNMNFTKGNTLDCIAFKCLYEPTFFIKNKGFFHTMLKHIALKAGLVCIVVFLVLFFLYQLLASSSSVLQSFTKYGGENTLNVSKVINQVEMIEKDLSEKKALVNFYSAFSRDSYQNFMTDFRKLVHGSVYIKELAYSCLQGCNGQNSSFEAVISGNASNLQDYYNLVSDVRRVFYRHDIERRVNEASGDFTIKITTLSKNQ